MKHIKRKFHSEFDGEDELFSKLDSVSVYDKEELRKLKLSKDQKCYLSSDNGKIVEAFLISINGKKYYIPEPNPVLVYFDIAQRQYKSIIEGQKEVLDAFNIENTQLNYHPHKIYSYFELSAVFVISLFTSIEAFINKSIPENYEYKKKAANKTEIYNKVQIERHISFDIKIKKILPEITNKDFASLFPTKFQHIENLKEFRDAVIHTKTSKDGHTPYAHIFSTSFKFKYEHTLHSVRDFINYYSQDLIEECGCGMDL